ncbi:hypothetical protein BH11CYA1_BH11CYA1_07120 [soil metagenome]
MNHFSGLLRSTKHFSVGFFWIQLRSCWYGLLAVLFGASISAYGMRTQTLGTIYFLSAVVMFLADTQYIKESETIVDRLIAVSGSVVAKTVFPYHPIDNLPPPGVKPVIGPNTNVSATTPLGNIAITSGNGLMRTITWDGVSSSVSLTAHKTAEKNAITETFSFPDPAERYRHKYTFHRQFWNLHKGVSKCIFSEERKYFSNQTDALKYLSETSCCAPRVYNNRGLAISWSQHDDAFDVTVVQLVINGKEPKSLPGADDSKIKVAALPKSFSKF